MKNRISIKYNFLACLVFPKAFHREVELNGNRMALQRIVPGLMEQDT